MPSEIGIVHVIDDDEALRDSLTFLLRAVKIDVQTYSSAIAFLDALPDIHLSCGPVPKQDNDYRHRLFLNLRS